MTVFAATRDSVTTIRERFAELDNPPTYPDDSDIEALLDNSNIVARLDGGAFGLAVYQPPEGGDGHESSIVYLLPEVIGVGRLSLLVLELLEGLWAIDAAQSSSFIGRFHNGFDAGGREDFGKGKAEAWARMSRAGGRFDTGLEVNPIRNAAGVLTGYSASWMLEPLVTRFRELLRGP